MYFFFYYYYCDQNVYTWYLLVLYIGPPRANVFRPARIGVLAADAATATASRPNPYHSLSLSSHQYVVYKTRTFLYCLGTVWMPIAGEKGHPVLFTSFRFDERKLNLSTNKRCVCVCVYVCMLEKMTAKTTGH